MDGNIGLFTVKPDQMQVINPLLILLFIPLYDVLFYPLLNKIGIRRPLQKLTLGGILAGVAFLISGIVELQLESGYPVLPSAGVNQFRLFNTLPCDYTVNTNIADHSNFVIKSLESYQQHIPINGSVLHPFTMSPTTINERCPTLTGSFNLTEHTAQSFFIRRGALQTYVDSPAQSSSGVPLLRVLANLDAERRLTIVEANEQQLVRFEGTSDNTTLIEMVESKFDVLVDDQRVETIALRLGAVATLLLVQEPTGIRSSLVFVTPENTMSMMWLLPQYIIMTLGEVMYSITGLSFSYAQAPVSMKSVLQACWLLTVAFGNVIDIIVVGLRIFELQSNEFFLFAGLMFIDMLCFMWLAYNYKPLNIEMIEEEPLVEESPANPIAGIDNIAFTNEPSAPLANDKTQ